MQARQQYPGSTKFFVSKTNIKAQIEDDVDSDLSIATELGLVNKSNFRYQITAQGVLAIAEFNP